MTSRARNIACKKVQDKENVQLRMSLASSSQREGRLVIRLPPRSLGPKAQTLNFISVDITIDHTHPEMGAHWYHHLPVLRPRLIHPSPPPGLHDEQISLLGSMHLSTLEKTEVLDILFAEDAHANGEIIDCLNFRHSSSSITVDFLITQSRSFYWWVWNPGLGQMVSLVRFQKTASFSHVTAIPIGDVPIYKRLHQPDTEGFRLCSSSLNELPLKCRSWNSFG